MILTIHLARVRARALQFLMTVIRRVALSLMLGRGCLRLRCALLLAAAGSDSARASQVSLLRLRALIVQWLLALELAVLLDVRLVQFVPAASVMLIGLS